MSMKKAWHSIHPNFKLNGHARSIEGLWDVGYSLVKESGSYEVEIGDFLLDWLSESKTVRVNTSGTTGTPKTITLHKEHMINSALATGRYFSLQPADTALLCLPCKYISGKMMLVRAMVLGLELDYVEPTSNPLQSVDKKYDFAAMVPLQVQNSIAKIEKIKTLLVGGAKPSEGLLNTLSSKTVKAFETYGMTETISHIAVNPIDDNRNGDFQTLPNIVIAKDERGCLQISAPKLGIAKMTTNDMVEITSTDRFKWLGRYDNVINSGGVKLIPEQLEAKLMDFIPNRFFVAGVPDKSLGEKMILVVEGDVDDVSLLKDLKSAGELSKHEVPKAIINSESFAVTQSGKLQRKKTLQQLGLIR